MKQSRMDQLQQMLKDDPESSFILFAIAQEYQQADLLPHAIQYYNKLKAIDQKYVGLYYHLAKCYVDTEDNEQAISTYDKGIEIAQSLGDHHALAELKNAKVNFEMEL